MDDGRRISSRRQKERIETLAEIFEKAIPIATGIDEEMPIARQELPRGIIACEWREIFFQSGVRGRESRT